MDRQGHTESEQLGSSLTQSQVEVYGGGGAGHKKYMIKTEFATYPPPASSVGLNKCIGFPISPSTLLQPASYVGTPCELL